MPREKPRPNPPNEEEISEERRAFLHTCWLAAPLLPLALGGAAVAWAAEEAPYSPREHYYAMGVDMERCIGCGRCVDACKSENDVRREPFYFRTWVERYVVNAGGDGGGQPQRWNRRVSPHDH